MDAQNKLSQNSDSPVGYQLAAIVIISLLLIRTAAITHRQILHILGFYLLGLIGYLITILLLNSGVIDEGTIPQHIAILVMGLAAIRLAGLILFHRLLPLIQIHAPTILQDILVTIAYLLWCMVRLSEIGLDFSSIVTTSAVITAVLAFSLQDTLGNILGGTALQLDDSIHIGDWVKVDDAVGRVVDICWRSTSIETRNWETVVIPNSILMKGKFTILGRRQGEPIQLRRWINFNVEFNVTPALVIHTVESAMHQAGIPNVAAQPAANCVAMSIEGSTINYALRYWLTDLAVDDPTDSAVRTHIYAALKRASIEFALPQQSLHLYKESHKLRAKEHSRDIKQRIALLERVALFATLDEEARRAIAEQLTSGSRYFCGSMFWASKPSKRQILNATVYAYGAPTSCVRCVITSSRLYTTPSLTLRRHKAAAASSPSFAHAQLRICRRRRLSGTNRPHFALHGGQRTHPLLKVM
ncbi:mechanosensitive ion channel family protein [Candidatus Reidiella endopervernicosa]|uniref:Mechanosensitive ion channel family protein n=1 Tax=Candidatus Reidiella endopervernicosa TaxID=2738883 RepID=A0A6N0HT50_9GAMM|nr:mechanosensitive ion channel family protein [Candidatus Reidiella endopervernicosa]QKQ25396.1 mechanosensitive ion channel family protein [Candidatus Reidiella endopervernicosa]